MVIPMSKIGNYEVKKFPKSRKMVFDLVEQSAKKHHVKAVFEVDVTIAREFFRKHKEETGEKLSFTGWVIRCIGGAAKEYPEINSIRKGRKKYYVFEDIDISITWHPGIINGIALQSNNAMNNVFFKFYGKTAHAAGDPYNGRSALDAVELMNVGANYMREHMIPDARLHYVITNGGLAPNVVPAEAEVHYFVRAPERHQVDELYNRLIKVAEGAVLMTETRLEIDFLSGTYNPLRNDVVNNVIYEKMKELGPPIFNKDEKKFAQELKKTVPPPDFTGMKKIVPPEKWEKAMKNLQEPLFPVISSPLGKGTVAAGSTDVGDVSWYTPLGEFGTACHVNGSPGHSWQNVVTSGMSIGHKGMIKAAQIICLTALEFLDNPELVKKAREEFNNTFKDKNYKSPFPEGYKLPFHRLIEKKNK